MDKKRAEKWDLIDSEMECKKTMVEVPEAAQIIVSFCTTCEQVLCNIPLADAANPRQRPRTINPYFPTG